MDPGLLFAMAALGSGVIAFGVHGLL